MSNCLRLIRHLAATVQFIWESDPSSCYSEHKTEIPTETITGPARAKYDNKLVARATSRSRNMESKSNNTNVLLFGLSFNLILTLSSLGFICYSFHRLDLRLTAVEQELLATSRQQRLGNRVHVDPTLLHSRQSGSQKKEVVVKRAVDTPSMCRKCSSVCGHRNVSFFLINKYSPFYEFWMAVSLWNTSRQIYVSLNFVHRYVIFLKQVNVKRLLITCRF